MQRLYFYIDDSGVFCRKNNQYFIFAGYCLTSYEEKEFFLRKYAGIERVTKKRHNIRKELKGYNVKPKVQDNILRSMNQFRKFAAVINVNNVHDSIMRSKYSSQRYKDFALKLAIKNKIQKLIREKVINPKEDIHIVINIDQHNTATDGKYGLKESIHEELQNGMISYAYNKVHPPIFQSKVCVDLTFCNSRITRGIRAADFVANKLFYEHNHGKKNFSKKCYIKYLP